MLKFLCPVPHHRPSSLIIFLWPLSCRRATRLEVMTCTSTWNTLLFPPHLIPIRDWRTLIVHRIDQCPLDLLRSNISVLISPGLFCVHLPRLPPTPKKTVHNYGGVGVSRGECLPRDLFVHLSSRVGRLQVVVTGVGGVTNTLPESYLIGTTVSPSDTYTSQRTREKTVSGDDDLQVGQSCLYLRLGNRTVVRSLSGWSVNQC